MENRAFSLDADAAARTQPVMDTAWHDDDHPDSPLAALPWSAVHEWFPADTGRDSHTHWNAPMSIFVHLALQALRSPRAASGRCILWIGRTCWWYPRTRLSPAPAMTQLLFDRSLFVDPADDAQRLWTIDLALRSPGVLFIVADGRRIRMPESRRLQLAAASSSAMVLLARPPDEAAHLSAARTRWRITPQPDSSHTPGPRWTIELLRYKGMQPAKQDAHTLWTIQRNHETGAVDLLSASACRDAAAPPTRRWQSA